MKNALKAAVALAGVIASLGLPELASARTRPGFGGRASSSSVDPNAFVYDAAVVGGTNGLGLRNTNGSTQSWLYDLVLDTSKAYTVIVRVAENGLSTGSVSCSPVAVGLNGVGISGGTSASSTNTTGYQNLTMTTPVVPAGGTLYVVCQISGNSTAKVLSIDWF